jgi:YegS/Rv2252/BmrU family lipid kinase
VDRPVALLCNPSAGGGRAARLLPRAERALREVCVGFHTEVTRDLEHGRNLARTAARAGEVTVTLSGVSGDRLIGCVVGVLREFPGSALGILPGGRGHDTARVLGIPSQLEAACAVIAGGVERDLDVGAERDLDVGEVGGRSFIGIASLGFDSDANRIADGAPARLGRLVYIYGALRALAAWQPARFELRLDGEPISSIGYSVAACNSGCYGGGIHLAPDAALDDGLLDVVLIAGHSKRSFLATLPKAFKGTHVRHAAVRVLRGSELRVDADRPFTVYADGGAITATPATIRVVPPAPRALVAV